MARHVHADLIHAWADGAEIQAKVNSEEWIGTQNPTWHLTNEYRIKPRTVKREGWVNLYHVNFTPDALAAAGHVYETKEIALAEASVGVIATVKISWEETV